MCEIAQEKAQTVNEVWPLIRFVFNEPVEDEKAWRKVMKGRAGEALAAAREAIAGIDAGGFTAEAVEAALTPLPEQLELGAGKVYQPVRVAITGTSISPGIFESVSVLGQEETLARIDAALARLAAATRPRSRVASLAFGSLCHPDGVLLLRPHDEQVHRLRGVRHPGDFARLRLAVPPGWCPPATAPRRISPPPSGR